MILFSLFVSPQQSHWGPSPFLRDVGQVSSLSATVRKGLAWVGDKEGTQAVRSPPSASRGRAAYPLGLDLSFSSFFPPPVTIYSPQDQDDKDHPRKRDTKSLTPKLGNATTTPGSPPRRGLPRRREEPKMIAHRDRGPSRRGQEPSDDEPRDTLDYTKGPAPVGNPRTTHTSTP